MSTAARETYLQRIIDTQSAIVQATLDLDAFMQLIVDTLQDLTEAVGAVIELVDGEHMLYRAASGAVAPHVGLRLRRDGSLSGLCVARAEVLLCEDSETDPRVDREACRRVGVRSMICAPLFRAGEAVGVLKVMSRETHGFDAEDVQTLNLLSGLLAAALGKQLAFDALHQAEARLRVLLDNAQDAVISVDEAGRILRWNRAAERLFGWPANQVIGQPIHTIAQQGDGSLAEIFDDFRSNPALFQLDLRPEMQLTLQDGRCITVEYSVGINEFEQGKELNAFLHDVTVRKSLELAMRDMALTDGLTGLPNRRKIVDALHTAILRYRRHPTGMVLMFLDMNGFKLINDTYGHDLGDRALQEFAHRLRATVRETDVVGRLGGDEFVVLAEDVGSSANALQIAEKIIAAMINPLGATDIRLATSIGICHYEAPWGQDEWLKRADAAMYAAKQQRTKLNRIAVFDDTMLRP
ncbi:diguanylate cyclase domain-containing protein [Chitinimonas sp. BJYL2]|uniref:diguanylate cyclase domain-containing protein n=1 Tax=Chitinimonas sp. BJYL2 TaxID=2976696 RepID=UPI0022B5D965|nr:diguanylate cyclase [Chitinimonas sp. BJYL2]